MPLSLLIFVFQPTRLSSLVWRFALVAFFPLLTLKHFSLSLTLQIASYCSSFTLCSLSCLATHCSHAIFRSWSDPSWLTPPLLTISLLVISQFYLFLYFVGRPVRGHRFYYHFSYFYSTLFHFVGFFYRLYFSLFSYFETCMQAWRLTGCWRCTHDRLFFSFI